MCGCIDGFLDTNFDARNLYSFVISLCSININIGIVPQQKVKGEEGSPVIVNKNK